MDTSDSGITFDAEGACNHCRHFEANAKERTVTGLEGERKLSELAEVIKRSARGRAHDCIVGVSGGVDSTYVAYLAKKLGLRVLAVHFDNGWNSELAVSNIEKTLRKLDIDLITYVVEWEEFKDIQLSFLKASTPDSEIPTDHAIFAVLMKTAAKHGIKYVLSGTNFNTEGIHVESWGYGHNDWAYIKGIHRRFGSKPIKTFPYYSVSSLFYHLIVKGIKFISPLNYIAYDKTAAISELERELGWQYYGGKHHESIYTRFFQSYILPKKFGIDKRRSHLSALIYSSKGKFTREMALEELSQEICPEHLLRQDKIFVIKKLGLSEQQFEEIMGFPVKSFRDYPSRHALISRLKLLQNFLRKKNIFHK
ncbi:MAG: N-acetyl sugar amidotransferase [Deltaproteobacteria bacterium]|nr:N-acetyl sugar amidotransferase [Deltaproteobacteria bacterium]